MDKYIAGKHGQIEDDYGLPQLEPILGETCIIYQELIMRISQVLAGYSLGERVLRTKRKLPVPTKKKGRHDASGSLACPSPTRS